MRIYVAALAFSLSGIAPGQQPVEPPRYNTVDLQAEAQREIANDLMTAVLFAEMNDSDAARLANAMNRAINDGISAAKGYQSVRFHTGAVQTFPVYDRSQRLTGWRGRADIRIDSNDFQAACSLIAKLQATLQLGSVGFTVSPALRRQTQDALMAEAIAAFRARAKIARAALDGRGYKIRRMSVSPGGIPGPRTQFALARAAQAQDAATVPQFEGGISQISVAVNGSVEVE